MCKHPCWCKPRQYFFPFTQNMCCRLCSKTEYMGFYYSYFYMERDKKTDWCKTCLQRDKHKWLDRMSKVWIQTKNKKSPSTNFIHNDDLMRKLFTCLI